jgi:hypothetical protein
MGRVGRGLGAWQDDRLKGVANAASSKSRAPISLKVVKDFAGR